MAEVLELLGAIWSYTFFPLGDNEVTTGALLIFLATLVVAEWISRILERIVRRILSVRGVRDDGTIAAITRLLHYAVLILAAVIALETLGFDLTTLLAAGAILGLGLGLAMQDIVQNFLSGVILLLEQTITPGDVLSIDGKVVLVEEMRIRTTIARSWDDDQLIIPNSTLVQSTVTNFTLTDSLYRIRSKVGVAYDTDLDHAQAILVEAAAKVENQAEKPPAVGLWEFGDSAIIFDVSIWVENPWTARVGRSDLNFRIWRGLRDAGITIAFPQLDIHLDPGALRPNADSLPSASKSKESGP